MQLRTPILHNLFSKFIKVNRTKYGFESIAVQDKKICYHFDECSTRTGMDSFTTSSKKIYKLPHLEWTETAVENAYYTEKSEKYVIRQYKYHLLIQNKTRFRYNVYFSRPLFPVAVYMYDKELPQLTVDNEIFEELVNMEQLFLRGTLIHTFEDLNTPLQ